MPSIKAIGTRHMGCVCQSHESAGGSPNTTVEIVEPYAFRHVNDTADGVSEAACSNGTEHSASCSLSAPLRCSPDTRSGQGYGAQATPRGLSLSQTRLGPSKAPTPTSPRPGRNVPDFVAGQTLSSFPGHRLLRSRDHQPPLAERRSAPGTPFHSSAPRRWPSCRA